MIERHTQQDINHFKNLKLIFLLIHNYLISYVPLQLISLHYVSDIM